MPENNPHILNFGVPELEKLPTRRGWNQEAIQRETSYQWPHYDETTESLRITERPGAPALLYRFSAPDPALR
jgi:hypothetical protein